MEILELFVLAMQFCGCFLELAAATSSGAAGYTGYQVYKEGKRKKEGIAADPSAKPPPTWARFVAWVVVASILVSVVILRWIAVAARNP